MAIRIGRHGHQTQAERAKARGAKAGGDARAREADGQPGQVRGGDTVKLQGHAAAVSTVKAASEGTPEVSEARVAELKSAIAEGRYTPDAEAIAGAMIKEAADLEG